MDLPENTVEMINEHLGGYNTAMGLRFVAAMTEKFVAEIEIADCHLQPYGLVHGGVYAAMIETVCSVGAAVNLIPEGKTTVGLENNTSFIRAVRSGTLRCTAIPVLMGKRSHVWQAQVHDDQNRLIAIGRVRMLVLEAGSAAGGETVALNT